MLIHLNGMPGVGKLTVAEILAQRIPAHLLDNHSLINAAYTPGYQHGSDDYLRLLQKISIIVYDELAQNQNVQHLVMTNALANGYAPDPARFAAIISLATRRKEPFVPVLLTCNQPQNAQRLISPERALKKKLRNPDILAENYKKYTLIHPADHPNQLAIDTTHLQPEQTADTIMAHVQKFLVPSPSHLADAGRAHPSPARGEG